MFFFLLPFRLTLRLWRFLFWFFFLIFQQKFLPTRSIPRTGRHWVPRRWRLSKKKKKQREWNHTKLSVWVPWEIFLVSFFVLFGEKRLSRNCRVSSFFLRFGKNLIALSGNGAVCFFWIFVRERKGFGVLFFSPLANRYFLDCILFFLLVIAMPLSVARLMMSSAKQRKRMSGRGWRKEQQHKNQFSFCFLIFTE